MKRFLSLVALLTTVNGPSAAVERPNIIFVLANDMGLGDLSCYGGTITPTPQIDRLAKEGTRFTQYYSASPICSPSHCGLITGQFPARWKITSYLQTRAGNRECEQADYLDPLVAGNCSSTRTDRMRNSTISQSTATKHTTPLMNNPRS